MALKQAAEFYGFGSYFHRRQSEANDIDLLIVHADHSKESIEFVLKCKYSVLAAIPAAHITILSYKEQRELAFIIKCRAIHLGTATAVNLQADVNAILVSVLSFDRIDRPVHLTQYKPMAR